MLVATLVCGAATSVSPPVRADVPLSKSEKAEARKHWDRATKLYDLGRYDEAIKEFEASYEISGAPSLLFNIAQAYRLKGNCSEALAFYKRYLMRSPDAVNRAEADEKIAEMQACVDKASAPATAPPGPEPGPRVQKPSGPVPRTEPQKPPARAPEVRPGPAPVEPESKGVAPIAPVSGDARPGHSQKMLGLGVGGAGLLTIALGAYFAGEASHKANQLSSRFEQPGEWDDEASQLEDEGRSAGQKAVVFTSIGIGAVLGGVALYWLGAREDARVDRGVALGPTHGGWQVAWSCAF